MNAVTVCLTCIASVAAFANAPGTDGASSRIDNDVALVLDSQVPETQYSKTLRCLSTTSYESVEVLDGSHLLFWGRGGRVWLNQLRTVCFGLTQDKILQFNIRGNSVCENDRFQALDRMGQFGLPSAFCGLDKFELITATQAAQVRDMLARLAHTQVPPVPAEPPSE